LVETRRGAAVLLVIGLGAYALRATAWPATVGRDLDEYVYAYLQLFDRDVLLPWSLLFRTPVTPLVAGSVLDLAGGFFVEPLLALLYAFSIVAWSRAALVFGRRVALVTAVALLLYHGYALMFHELSSEPMLAAAFAGFAWALARAYDQPTTRRFLLVGLAASVTVLARPGSIVLLVFAFLPLALRGTWRSRLRWSAAFTAAALVPLALWTLHNGLRLDYWGLARGGNAVIPLYRAFVTDRIVRADNGPASRRLATAMQRDLLTREPYRTYGVTLDELFRQGSFRVHEDLYLLSDRYFGWDSNYAVLRNAGIEAVKAHPGAYASGVSSTIWDELSQAHFRLVEATEPVETPESPPPRAGSRSLPTPSEGEPIPPGQNAWISRPDGSIGQVWTSPTQYRFTFANPGERERFDAILRRRDELFRGLPDRNGRPGLALRLNQLSRWYPRPWQWIVVGLIVLAVRRPRGALLLLALTLGALLVVLVNAVGLLTDLHFVLPVAPAFVLLGVGALLGARPPRSAVEPAQP
jgi:hypothetical protein